MESLAERIKTALRPCVGPERAISAPELATRIAVPERTIRKTIAADPNLQPCGKAGAGYFWPSNAEQIHAVDDRFAAQEKAIRQRRRLFRAFWQKQGIAFPK